MKARLAASLTLAAGALMGMSAEAKTLRWSSPTDITTLDPYAHTESFTTSMLHHVFDPLVRRSRNSGARARSGGELEDREAGHLALRAAPEREVPQRQSLHRG